MATESIDRDAIKHNVAVLEIAAQTLGLRVGVSTCVVHVSALYQLMQIPVARHFAYYWCLYCCDSYGMSVVIYWFPVFVAPKDWFVRAKGGCSRGC